VAVSSLATGIGILVYLAVVPLIVQCLGPERTGVWLTLGAITSLVGVAVSALAGSTQNDVSVKVARGEWLAATRNVSTAVFLASVTAVLATALLAGSVKFISWPSLLGVHRPEIRDEVQKAAVLALIIPTLSLPIAVLQRTLTALQRGYIVDAWRIVALLVTLPAMYFAERAGATLVHIVGLFAGLPALAAVGSVLVTFSRRYAALRPTLRHIETGLFRSIVMSAGAMVAWQAGQAVLAAAPVLLTARLFGARAAAGVGLVQRLSQMPIAAMTIVALALWPAWADAVARSEVMWLRAAARRLVLATVVFVAFLAPLTWFFSPAIVAVWSRGQLSITRNLAAAFAVLTAASVVRGAIGIPLLGDNRTRVLGITTAIAAMIGCVPFAVPAVGRTPEAVVLWIAGCELMISATSSLWILPSIKLLRNTHGSCSGDVAAR
jgi:O-antigen/teichoic acid export membrane protein